MVKEKLGELLVSCGLITQEQLSEALEAQKQDRKRLGSILIERGYASEDDIARSLATRLGLPFVDLTNLEIEPESVATVDEKLARRHLVLPIRLEGRSIRLAMTDPLDLHAIEDIRFHTGYEVLPVVSLQGAIKSAINRHYDAANIVSDLIGDVPEQTVAIEVVSKGEPRLDEQKLRRLSEALPVVRVVNLIFAEAVRESASDIHIEPGEQNVVVRTRVDGILQTRMTLPKWVQPAVTSRIKIMSRLDITEKRLPQDGRVQIRIDSEPIDLRVSTLPAKHGEKLVIRVLPRTSVPPLEDLGMDESTLGAIRELVNQPQGVVLVTGPTGSGKSTTLYAALGEMSLGTLNVITLEDPIEYGLEAINQVQISEKTGLSFAVGLRSVLRQDPDVIYVGEMRDEETASVALKASLTGHLVLSTLHTNTSVAAVTRLMDMGIPSYLVGSAVTGVLSQRLLRVICDQCKQPAEHRDSELAGLETFLSAGADVTLSSASSSKKGSGSEANQLKAWVDTLLKFERPQAETPRRTTNGNGAGIGSKIQLFKGAGCKACNHTGYSGRTGVFELLRMTPPVRELVYRAASESKITKTAEQLGMKSLLHKACEKLLAGETSLEEVIRVMATEQTRGEPCKGCGVQLESDFVACPHCGLSSLQSCPSCGNRAEPTWRFCAYCRKPLSAAVKQVARAK